MPISHVSESAKLTDQQHMLIGRFVAEWANAETLLGNLLGRLLLTPEFLSRTYTDWLGAAQIQDAICQAVEIHRHRFRPQLVDGPDLDLILKLNQEIGKLRSARNRYAHFCWSRSSDTHIFGTNFSGATPTDKRFPKSYVSLEVTEMKRQCDELYKAVEALQSVLDRLPELHEQEAINALTFQEVGR